MTKAEFIAELRAMADDLEKGTFHVIDLREHTYIFGNRNYGEVSIKLNDATSMSVNLYTATNEEKEEAKAKTE